MANFTRIIGGLNERVVIPLEDSFQTRRFAVSRGDSGWRVEPTTPGVADTFELNERVISSRALLHDDDVLRTNLDRWIFHDGVVLRDDALERAAIEQGGASWDVLADWLAEGGDPLGERINANHTSRRPVPPLQLDSDPWATVLAHSEERGVISSLVARSNADRAEVLAALTRRRVRFLENLVIDTSPEQVSSWVSQLETWPLPRWLRSLSLGHYLGAAPNALPSRLPTQRLRALCPMLRTEPLFTWNATPTLTLKTRYAVVDGIAPGATISVRTGLKIERKGQRLSVHAGEKQTDESATFFVEERHCYFEPMGVRRLDDWTRTLGAGVENLTRTRLLHDDVIEAAPGVTFRFRLRD